MRARFSSSDARIRLFMSRHHCPATITDRHDLAQLPTAYLARQCRAPASSPSPASPTRESRRCSIASSARSSPSPATSRSPPATRSSGIVTRRRCQIVLLDTPGLLEPRYELQHAMRVDRPRALARRRRHRLSRRRHHSAPPTSLEDAAASHVAPAAPDSSSPSTRSTCLQDDATVRSREARPDAILVPRATGEGIDELLDRDHRSPAGKPFLYRRRRRQHPNAPLLRRRAGARNGTGAAEPGSAVHRRLRDRGVSRGSTPVYIRAIDLRRARQPEAHPDRREGQRGSGRSGAPRARRSRPGRRRRSIWICGSRSSHNWRRDATGSRAVRISDASGALRSDTLAAVACHSRLPEVQGRARVSEPTSRGLVCHSLPAAVPGAGRHPDHAHR